jgi:hypothetical protein
MWHTLHPDDVEQCHYQSMSADYRQAFIRARFDMVDLAMWYLER